ncbi:hypothetical protein Pyn_02266 [Prunus yedoensis var. nudiflora]|uniref:Uncharacterized protein n=1 Tax=Prunus yedoensis var. nudiflora TaxID=2094558 RepID=A0A314ZWU1_PRUYE|nr:hypothetical protein Pyn_02266 [Prunus yedoensis var. nudiflora]
MRLVCLAGLNSTKAPKFSGAKIQTLSHHTLAKCSWRTRSHSTSNATKHQKMTTLQIQQAAPSACSASFQPSISHRPRVLRSLCHLRPSSSPRLSFKVSLPSTTTSSHDKSLISFPLSALPLMLRSELTSSLGFPIASRPIRWP